MLTLSSFVEGFKNVWTNKFLIGMMFLFKLVFSLALLSPLYVMFSASFATNVKATNFLNWYDLSLFIDFVYYWKKTLSIYFFVFILVCGIAMVVFIFLSGGFWGMLRDGVKKSGRNSRMEKFFGYSGKYFWGMFKISLFLIGLYFIVLFLFLFLSTIFDSVAGKANLWEITSWRMVAKFLIGIILFFLVNMIGDYLRIFFIENYGERFLKVVGKTYRFLLTNLFRTLSLYYFLSVILIAAIFVYMGLTKVMNVMPQTGLFIFLTFLIQQIFVVFSSFYRLAYYSSQLVLYDKISLRKTYASF
ncbi:MAG: hypothetical protein KAX39_02525 [candidate division Zixibacteria bacterium]|nr:hypothetical protein [candidate division Zixibacteria bacterium]